MRKKKYGIVKEKALLRTLATKKDQPYALRRLMKDLQEIEKNQIPTVGVTARPQNDNMYVWHANLRGPEGTAYEGGVFHLVMNFPTNYPHSPPTITLSTPIPHPCVSGSVVNLDMLDSTRKGVYEGWTSGYSVLSILLQLQSFLFEAPPDYKQRYAEIREAVKKANELVLPEIGHKGPLSPWPPFATKEKETDPNSYKIKKTKAEIILDQLICFHTKLTYNEAFLGLGVSIARLPRTGEIRSVEPTLDLISLKAFMKESVRHSLDNTAFTHWLPIYFGQKTEDIKYLSPKAAKYLAEKSLSMICKGSTKKFDPKFIIEVFPKLMVTLVVNMMEQKEHTSLKALRAMTYFFRLFVFLLDAHPELYDQIEASLDNFKKDEKFRIKDNCQNLGDLLCKLTVSKKFKWNDLIGAYLEEQMDRQVFWLLKDIPELEKMDNDNDVDDERINVSFRGTMVGFHLTLFFATYMTKIIQKEQQTREQLLTEIDEMYGRLSEENEALLQKACNDIRKVNDYYGYFKMLGVPFPSKKELFGAIKKSIVNSRRKQYHGSEDLLNVLPETNKMIGDFQKGLAAGIEDFVVGDKLMDANQPKWREVCVAKFPWIHDYYDCVPEKERLTPAALAAKSDSMKVSSKEEEIYVRKNKENLAGEFEKVKTSTSLNDYDSQMTWRDLFLKLDMEYFMEMFNFNPDFKKFYKLLDIIAPHIRCLSIMVIIKKRIKSGYHWLTSLFSKLVNLTCIKLYTRNIGGLSIEVMKCLYKGLCNFNKAGGKLLKMEFNRMPVLTDQKLLVSMRNLQDLRVIVFKGVYVTQPIAAVLNKVLTDFKFIQELDLTDCKLTVPCGKEIADGLMRAKQMEIFRIANNPAVSDAIPGIIYNLAFSPKITLLEISNNNLASKNAESIESLYKLLTISGSLRTLLMDQCNINNYLPQQFFKALGQNKTLMTLSMNGSQFAAFDLLGRAIGLNAKRNGSLEHFSALGCVNGYNNLNTLLDNIWVSDYDNELWYGDEQEARKMFGDQRLRKFHCNLKEFILGNSNLVSNFHASSLKHEKYENYPKLVKFMIENTKLRMISFPSCYLNKFDGDLLAFCLKSEEMFSNLKVLNIAKNALRKEGAKALCASLSNEKCILEHLDLSGNRIGVSGAQAFAEVLKVNKSLKILSLFSNLIDVDGARSLNEALKINETLVELDLGLNRLREKGAKEIAEGIYENKKSALRILGLRFNFISEDGITEFFNKAIFDSQAKLNHIYIKGNYLTEPTIVQLQTQIAKKNLILHVDVFEKLKYLLQNKLDRSIWVTPVWANDPEAATQLRTFFEENHKVGVVVDIRLRTGPKIPGKPKPNIYAIIEFAHVNSVPRALRVASKKLAVIRGNRLRIYKAGTRTQAIVKPQKVKRSKK